MMSNKTISVPSAANRYHVQVWRLDGSKQRYASGALGAIEVVRATDYDAAIKELEELRAFLAQPAEQHLGEPVAWMVTDMNGDSYFAYDMQTPADKPLYTRPAEQTAQKYDDTLMPFMALMRKELHANAGKGDRPGWLAMSSDTCLLEIIYHFGKLQASVKRGDSDGMAEYAADVANMCMMLLDICGVLAFVEKDAPVAGPGAPECRCKRYGKDNPHWPCPVHSAACAGCGGAAWA